MSRPWRNAAAALLLVSAIAGVSLAAPRQTPPPFPWPNGHRAALSLSFDDGRSSQVDAGMPVLGQLGLKVTFYVTPGAIEKRKTAWRAAAQGGHEIGNHSLIHPCSGNFAFARQKALEEYTLARMNGELEQATRDIARITGVTTTSFAYPSAGKPSSDAARTPRATCRSSAGDFARAGCGLAKRPTTRRSST
jgi:peptidoglycan/xylan/chitin deacetylase (PgdA/CDA1 family)